MAEILINSTEYENEVDVNSMSSSSTSSTTPSGTAMQLTANNSTVLSTSPQININSPISSLSCSVNNINSSGNSSCSSSGSACSTSTSNTNSNVISSSYYGNSVANANNNNINLFNEIIESSIETTSPSNLSISESGGSKDRPSSPAMSIISSKEIAALTTAQNSERKSSYTSTEKTFHRRFNCINHQERLLNYFACALVGEILLQGFLYITENYFAFYSNIFGYKTKILIPISEVRKVTREKTVRIIPNAVGICTDDEKYVFGSLLSRESTYRVLQEVLSKHISLSSVNVTVKSDLSEGKEEDNGNRLSSTPKIIINNKEALITNESTKCKLKLINAIKPNENNSIKKPIVSDTESDINSSDEITSSLNKRKSINTVKLFNISQFKWMNKRTLLYLSITFALIILLIFSIILLWRINTINKFLFFLSNANNQSFQQTPYFKEEMKRINFELLDKLDELSKLKQSLKDLLDSVEQLTSCNYLSTTNNDDGDNTLTKFIGRVDSHDNICAIKI